MEIYVHAKNYIYPFLRVLIFLILPAAVFAQNTSAPLINSRQEGLVIDSVTRQPIAGVTLQIKGVTHSVSTGPDGRFTFVTGQRLPYALIVSFIGYKTKEVIVDGTPVTIRLSDVVSQLG